MSDTTQRVVVGTAQVRAPMPLYEIHTVKDRKVSRTTYKRVPVEGGKPGQTEMKTETTEAVLPVSYLVYFPGGHAVAFDSVEHMQEAGINMNDDRLVDPESGEIVHNMAPMSLRARSVAKESLRGRRSA
jgi:hypothetical protein